jgi:hypothetical protein
MRTSRAEKIRACVVLALGILEHVGLLHLWRLMSAQRSYGDMDIGPIINYALISIIGSSIVAASLFALLLRSKMGDVSERRLWVGAVMLMAPWAAFGLCIGMNQPLISAGFLGLPVTVEVLLPWLATLIVYLAAFMAAHNFVTSRQRGR